MSYLYALKMLFRCEKSLHTLFLHFVELSRSVVCTIDPIKARILKPLAIAPGEVALTHHFKVVKCVLWIQYDS